MTNLLHVRPEVLVSTIAESHDPERVSHYFDEFQHRHPQLSERLFGDPVALRRVAIVFRLSRFLSEELLRSPEWAWSTEPFDQSLTPADYRDRLIEFLLARQPSGAWSAVPGNRQAPVPGPSAHNLAAFRRRELIRILARDGLNAATVPEITEEISNLADAILEHALEDALQRTEARYGPPIEEDSGQRAVFAVVALGKLGGRELNYSSDIDLMFLYSSNGQTAGEQVITNKEFFKKVANHLTNLLSTYTAAGPCYRVDLRLRPEGSLGDVCTSLAGAQDYYQNRARDWELQMLVKARVAAGDCELGESLLNFVHPLIYSTTLDFSTIESVSATRERLGEKLARRRLKQHQFDVKLARGGIRDIEFLAQCLQRLHGGRDASVRQTGTLYALSSLLDSDLISLTEHAQLTDAYKFLRNLEHRLQFDEDRQTHTLPDDPAELERIAGRMPGSFGAGTHLLRILNQHLERVQIVYDRIVHAQRPLSYSSNRIPANSPTDSAPDQVQVESRARVTQPSNELGSFLANVADHSQYRELLQIPAVSTYTEQIFELSPFLSQTLMRDPDLLMEVYWAALRPDARPAFESIAAPLNDVEGLRRFYAREMFRILASGLTKPQSVFHTLDSASGLTEFVIARAYRIALEQALAHGREHAGPEKPFSVPKSEMMVVALGRLGMREFDLGSDADVLFIIPDSESSRQRFWTRVAERMIHILTDYRGEIGTVLSLDTRLRPNGREGMLVQTEAAYVEYFSLKAEAWEGIAYMKARALAGDLDRATSFLVQLQQLDWRRYGQGGRSRQDLRQMRLRLQREQAAVTPLKAGEGGYYDADFILMYLRLKGAGLFFKSLNTPERIDIVEKMGHLDRGDAEFLLSATTYLRAVDHACRVVLGRAEEKLPVDPHHREKITKLVQFWTQQGVTTATVEDELLGIQQKLRRLFDSIFH